MQGQKQNNPKRRPSGKRPSDKTPKSVIIIYIIMAVIILAICVVVFMFTLKKTGDINYSVPTESSQTSSSVQSENSQSESSQPSQPEDSSSSSEVQSQQSQLASSVQSSESVPVSSSVQSSSKPAPQSVVSTQSSSEKPPVQEPVSTSELSLLGANLVYVGESFTYSYRSPVTPAKFPEIGWECIGDSGIIAQNGKFTATKKGEVTLIVTDYANNISGKLLVHVVESADDVDFIPMVNNIPVVNKTYPLPSDYNPQGLTAETNAAFNRLVKGAAADGINIYMISGFRSYKKQQSTYLGWCNKYGTEQADRISARAGHSEHQLGMAIDVNSLYEEFENTPEGKWLAAHCWEYGFIIRYPKGKESVTGYSYEPWHIRYLGKDLAKSVTESGLSLEEYLGIDSRYR